MATGERKSLTLDVVSWLRRCISVFRRHYAHKYGSLLWLLLLTGDPNNGLAFAERGAWLSFSTSPMTLRHFFSVGGTEEEEAEEVHGMSVCPYTR